MKIFLYCTFFIGFISLVFMAVLFSVYPLKYKNEISDAAKLYSVDKTLIASVINAESGYNPKAVSNKGAVGLMQVMPATAEWVAQQIGIEIDTASLKDPRTNILIGTYYLKYLLDKFKDTKTALIAYNAGEGNVITWLSDRKYATEGESCAVLASCPYPSTNKYVEKVLNGCKFYSLRI